MKIFISRSVREGKSVFYTWITRLDEEPKAPTQKECKAAMAQFVSPPEVESEQAIAFVEIDEEHRFVKVVRALTELGSTDVIDGFDSMLGFLITDIVSAVQESADQEFHTLVYKKCDT